MHWGLEDAWPPAHKLKLRNNFGESVKRVGLLERWETFRKGHSDTLERNKSCWGPDPRKISHGCAGKFVFLFLSKFLWEKQVSLMSVEEKPIRSGGSDGWTAM